MWSKLADRSAVDHSAVENGIVSGSTGVVIGLNCSVPNVEISVIVYSVSYGLFECDI